MRPPTRLVVRQPTAVRHQAQEQSLERGFGVGGRRGYPALMLNRLLSAWRSEQTFYYLVLCLRLVGGRGFQREILTPNHPPIMHTFPSHAVSHICLTAKTNKGTGTQTLAPVVLLSGTFASRGHRGVLHRVNKPICTNCCKNSQTQSLRWPVKARSVSIDVGVSVSNTWWRPRSSNFQR